MGGSRISVLRRHEKRMTKKHAQGVKTVKGKHLRVGASDGGACLARDTKDFKPDCSCSHRWQAYLKAEENSGVYDWPAYRSLSKRAPVQTSASVKDGKMFPAWYTRWLPAPEEHAWDVGQGENFKEKCYTPYWHNAHHLVPNGALRSAINEVGKGTAKPAEVRLEVRQGLLEVKYNLNFKRNLIILPIDKSVGRALKLPVHLSRARARRHSAYSKSVKSELDQIFSQVKEALKACEEANPPKYQSLKDAIEALSDHLYGAVRSAGGSGVRSLEAIPAASFTPPAQ